MYSIFVLQGKGYSRMALDGGAPGQDGAAGTAAARASRGSASRSR